MLKKRKTGGFSAAAKRRWISLVALLALICLLGGSLAEEYVVDLYAITPREDFINRIIDQGEEIFKKTGGHAQRAHGSQIQAELFLHICLQIGKAGLHAPVHRLHGVGPNAVHQLIFPFKASGGDRCMVLVDQHRLDASGAQLQT
jgi:hypothetical protein